MLRSRRTVVVGTSGLVLALGLAGCVTGGTAAPQGDGNQSGGEADKTLTVMNWEPREGSAIGEALSAFEEATGYEIEYQHPSGPGSDYWPKTRTVLASNNPPDLMRIDDDLVPYYASTGRLLDVADYLEGSDLDESAYFESVFHNTRQEDGSYVGMSLGSQPRVIFYNKTLFEGAGIPLPPSTWTDEGWTWDDFLAAAQALTVPGERYGASIMDDSGFDMIFTRNNGGTGRWTDDAASLALADQPDAEALQWVADLTCEHGVQPPWSEISQRGKTEEMFAAGNLAMVEDPSSFMNVYRENVTNFEWDIAPMPGNVEQKTYGSQVVFTVPAASDNHDGAWELLEFLMSEDGAKYFAESGSFVPGLRSAGELIQPVEGQSPANVALLPEGVENQVIPTRIDNVEEATTLYRSALDSVRNCQSTADVEMEKVRPSVEDAISRGNPS